jgi:hypothetical protein
LVVDAWMRMEEWWNDTDRGNWRTGRKTLYSVGGGWMNEYGAMVKWYWQGKLKYWREILVPVPLYTTNSASNDLGSNPDLRRRCQRLTVLFILFIYLVSYFIWTVTYLVT